MKADGKDGNLLAEVDIEEREMLKEIKHKIIPCGRRRKIILKSKGFRFVFLNKFCIKVFI